MVRKKNPEDGKELSKVTQVLINDLKGRRVVQHDFHGQNKREFGDEEKETRRIRKKQWWRIPHGSWVIGTGVIMLLFGLIAGATWESIFRGNRTGTPLKITSSLERPKEQRTISRQQVPKEKYRTTTNQYRKQQPERKTGESRHDSSYSGITSYPAPRKQITYAPPTITTYFIHFENGQEIQCEKILKKNDKLIRMIKGKEEIGVEKKYITAIMKKTVKGNKIETKYIKVDSL